MSSEIVFSGDYRPNFETEGVSIETFIGKQRLVCVITGNAITDYYNSDRNPLELYSENKEELENILERFLGNLKEIPVSPVLINYNDLNRNRS